MKKIMSIIVIGFVLVIGYMGYSYYSNTYKATMAYAVVPNEIPGKTETVDMNGEKITEDDGKPNYSYQYSFSFIKQDGKKQIQEYDITGTDPIPFEPGAYVKAEISNKRVVKGPYTVDKSEIPKDILEQLKK